MNHTVHSYPKISDAMRRGLMLYAMTHHKELGANGLAVLGVLCELANQDHHHRGRYGIAWPKQATIAALVDMPSDTVKKVIRKLVAAGLVEKLSTGSNFRQESSRYIPAFHLAADWYQHRDDVVRANREEDLDVTPFDPASVFQRNTGGIAVPPINRGEQDTPQGGLEGPTGGIEAPSEGHAVPPIPSITPSITPTTEGGVMEEAEASDNPATVGTPRGARPAGDKVRRENYSAGALEAVVTAYNNRAPVGDVSYVENALRRMLGEGWTIQEIVDCIEAAKSVPPERAAVFLKSLKRNGASTPIEAPQKAADAPTAAVVEDAMPEPQAPLNAWGERISVVGRKRNSLSLKETREGHYVGERIKAKVFDVDEPVFGTIEEIIYVPPETRPIETEENRWDIRILMDSGEVALVESLNSIEKAPSYMFHGKILRYCYFHVGQVVKGGPDNEVGTVEHVDYSDDFKSYIVYFCDCDGVQHVARDTELALHFGEAA